MQIAGLPSPSEDEYLNCIRCGLCLSVCPTYREHLTETGSPRGRVALTRKCLEGELEPSPGLMDQMYSCFACMACNDICPVGIRPADLALGMRQMQELSCPSGWKKILFGKLVPHPARMEWASLPLRIYETTGLRHLVHMLGIPPWMPEKIRDMEAMLPRLPQHPLRQVLPEIVPATTAERYRIGFFLGCAQSLLFSDGSKATIRVLARNGCTVITPKETVCCGMPAIGYGRQELAMEQARRNIALFERINAGVIVTDCATCGSTLKGYSKLLANDPTWAERADTFSKKVQDVSEFLASIQLDKPLGRIDARVTYHDPCHLRRGQGVWREPRALLNMIDGIELVELPEADWCCGSAGSQLITHYETSLRVLGRKMDNLGNTKADYIASGCPGCQMQLNAGVRRSAQNVQVVHPIELLDRAYRQ